MDNGFGNKTKIPPAISYVTTFKTLRRVLELKMDDSLTSKKKPSFCWALQRAHSTSVVLVLEGCLVIFDNLYTRYYLAAQVRKINYDEVSCLGTIQLNNLDEENKENVDQAVQQLPNVNEEIGVCVRFWKLSSPRGAMKQRLYIKLPPTLATFSGMIRKQLSSTTIICMGRPVFQ